MCMMNAEITLKSYVSTEPTCKFTPIIRQQIDAVSGKIQTSLEGLVVCYRLASRRMTGRGQ